MKINIPLPKFITGAKQSNENVARRYLGRMRSEYDTPFSELFSTYHIGKINMDLYDGIREAIPLMDVATTKLVRLIGGFRPVCENEQTRKELEKFIAGVKVNHLQKGLNSFVSQLADSAIVKGMGYGELVFNESLTDVYKLQNVKANYVEIKSKQGEISLIQHLPGIVAQNVITELDNIFCLSFDNRDGNPQGYSLFYSLPFMSQVFTRIFKSIENAIWRVGDPTFMVIVEGGEGMDTDDSLEVANNIQSQLTESFTARKTGKVQDVYGGTSFGGKVDVKVLGAEGQIMDLEIPTRTVLEQLVTKTEFPPFMFGLYKWTSTERMSTHQNDMIVANIQENRKKLDPIINEILEKFLIVKGLTAHDFGIEWNPVNLMDETEKAKAEYLRAQAAEKIYNRLINMMLDGVIDETQFKDELINRGLLGTKASNAPLTRVLKVIEKRVKEKQAIDMLGAMYGK